MSLGYGLALLAQVSSGQLDIPQGNLDSSDFTGAMRFVAAAAGGIALVVVTYGGFKYVMSQGNPQETAKAHNAILYALIGLVISISAFGIISFVTENV